MYIYKALYMSIHDFPGLKVVEVAHDMQLAVGHYVKQDLKLLNSFDTWHGMKWCSLYVCIGATLHHVGTKNVAKELAKITKGRVRDQDVTWFTELADKRMSLVCTM